MTGAPMRLIDQDLSVAERSLLDAREDGAPFFYDVDTGARRFEAALAVAAAVAGAQGAAKGSGALTGKGLFGALVVKGVVVLAALGSLFAGGLVIGTVIAGRSTTGGMGSSSAGAAAASFATPTPTPTPALTTETSIQTATPTAIASAVGAPAARVSSDRSSAPMKSARVGGAEPSAAAPVGTDPVAQVMPAQAAAPAPSSPSAPPAPTQVSAPAAAPNDSLSELRAVAAARNLVDRDPDAALAALDAIRRDHPNGYFVEERQALTILALAGAGKTSSARAQSADFLRAHPDGPYSDRIRAILRSQ